MCVYVCVCVVNVCVLGICGQRGRGLVPGHPTSSCGVFMIRFRMCISVGCVLCVRACPCVCVCVCVCTRNLWTKGSWVGP